MTLRCVSKAAPCVRRTIGMFQCLYINTLIIGAVWQYILPGADVHSPLSILLLLLVPVASDRPTGGVFKNREEMKRERWKQWAN